MNCNIENYLMKNFNMNLGTNKTLSRNLMRQLNKENLIARTTRCIYKIDNIIVKVSSDSTFRGLPFGADQCIKEFDLYNSKRKELDRFRTILCPVYAIYKSSFIYLTIHEPLTPLAKNDDNDETIYTYLEKHTDFKYKNEFLNTLKDFKHEIVENIPEVQDEFSKISSFGYDAFKRLYVLDYGIY